MREQRGEKEAVLQAASAKDEENAKLWEQVKAAANEYHADFVDKDATIEALKAELQDLHRGTQKDISKLRSEIEVGACGSWPLPPHYMLERPCAYERDDEVAHVRFTFAKAPSSVCTAPDSRLSGQSMRSLA